MILPEIYIFTKSRKNPCFFQKNCYNMPQILAVMITLEEKHIALKILWRIPFDWVPKGLNSLRQKDKDLHLTD